MLTVLGRVADLGFALFFGWSTLKVCADAIPAAVKSEKAKASLGSKRMKVSKPEYPFLWDAHSAAPVGKAYRARASGSSKLDVCTATNTRRRARYCCSRWQRPSCTSPC